MTSIGSCAVVSDAALKVAYLSWKASCFEAVAACLECIIGELKFSMDVIPFRLEVAVLVVNPTIVFDLCKRVPALLVCHSFVEGMKCGTRTYEQVVEPWWHRLSCF